MDLPLHQGIIVVAMGLPNPLEVMDLYKHQMAMERVIYLHPKMAMELLKHQVAMIVINPLGIMDLHQHHLTMRVVNQNILKSMNLLI